MDEQNNRTKCSRSAAQDKAWHDLSEWCSYPHIVHQGSRQADAEIMLEPRTGRPVYVTYELLRDKRREQGADQGADQAFLKAKEQKEAIAT